MALNDTESNYALFRECFSSAFLERVAGPEKSKTSRKKHKRRNTTVTEQQEAGDADDGTVAADQEELAEFIEPCQFLASEIFASLPESLRSLSRRDAEESPETVARWTTSLDQTAVDEEVVPLLPGTVGESVSTYRLLREGTSLAGMLLSAVAAYAEQATAAVVWSATRTDECEICARDWIPLSYHHLVPRSVQAKALRRGWHEERDINKVAWLCRSCHTFVHRCASNEQLAREFHTVEALLERQDVQDWAKWVARIRWRAK